MKKFISMLTILFILAASYLPVTDVCANDDTVTMYATDGREITVFQSEVEAYKAVGWYDNKSDVTQTLYAPDGREILVYLSEVDTYTNLGWYKNKNDITRTLYAPDGREILVYVSEVQTYKNVGWYENKSDVTQTLYAPDGREILVFKAEVPAYTSLGWYEDINDVITVMAANGQKINVFNSQVQDYINVGWIPVQGNKINPAKPMVALTFDDGPRAASTGRILNVLEQYNARATFFVIGNLAAQNGQILQRMQSLGCQIGNHSYTHPDLSSLSSYNILSQLNRTSDVIYNATGTYPTVIRPPYGSYNSNVLSTANNPLILWSIDTLDWKYRNTDRVVNEVISKAQDGDIVLMHDIYDTTAAAAERIVPALAARGFQLVTVDELATHKGKPMYAHNAYRSFK